MSLPAARIADPSAHGGVINMGFPTVLIGNMPAARIGDMHVCPMVTGVVPHVGGPIVLGAFTVLTGMVPQARQTDLMVCVGPPDTVMMGMPTVHVGMVGGGGIGAIFMGMALGGIAILKSLTGQNYPRSELINGQLVTKYSESITIQGGSAAYQGTVVSDLNTISQTKMGKALLAEYAKTGKHLTIQPIPTSDDQNNGGCGAVNGGVGKHMYRADGKPGTGTDSVIDYNPSYAEEYRGADGKTYNADPHETLAHEMVHGLHNAQGKNARAEVKPGNFTNREEMQTIGANDGIHDHSNDPITEAALSKEYGRSPRPDHDSVTGSTYQDHNGNWHKATDDLAGTTTDTVVPAPPGGGRPNR